MLYYKKIAWTIYRKNTAAHFPAVFFFLKLFYTRGKEMDKKYSKSYSVAIDTVPLPEEPAERVDLAVRSFGPVLLDMIRDAMSVAIGTWPTPEEPDRP